MAFFILCTGANSPTNLTAEQVNSTIIRVSWTPPDSGSTVTGYRIYYQTVGNQGSVDVGASTTEYTITSLVVNDTYIITLVALSEHLPSAIVGPEIVIPGKTSVIKWGGSYVGWYGKSWSKGMGLLVLLPAGGQYIQLNLLNPCKLSTVVSWPLFSSNRSQAAKCIWLTTTHIIEVTKCNGY